MFRAVAKQASFGRRRMGGGDSVLQKERCQLEWLHDSRCLSHGHFLTSRIGSGGSNIHLGKHGKTIARASLSLHSSLDRAATDNKIPLDASFSFDKYESTQLLPSTSSFSMYSSLQVVTPRHNMMVRSPVSSLMPLSSSSSWKRQYEQKMNDSLFQQQSKALFSTFSPPPSDDTASAKKSSHTPKKSTPSPSSSSSKRRRVARIPTPKSSPSSLSVRQSIEAIDPRAIFKTVWNYTWNITKTVLTFLWHLPRNLYFYAKHPQERKEKIAEIKEHAKKEFDHYKVGTKLLIADIQTARNLVGKTLSGSTLTRRERKQLLRTVSDLFRLVPFSMFLIIPFMEFALPFALRIFPNMLPSTFQDSLKAEETMKRELQSRIAMAQFFQETMEELAKEQKRIAANRKADDDTGEQAAEDSIASKQEACAADMLQFLDRARKGEMIPSDVIIQYANYFQDDLTLDNMPRMQLINMCKYMSIAPYGSDAFLRFQLRHRIRLLKEDDQRILWEGIDALTKMELREACQERGMRSTGLSKEAYKKSLQQWLDLSVNKNVPISLLIMSRTFFLQEEITSPASAASSEESQSVTGLADAISGMDKEVLNEVILQVATADEIKSDLDVRKIQLEVLTQQNEKIKEEQAERENAKKKKESSSSEKSDSPPSDEQVKEPLKATATVTGPVDVGTLSKEEILEKFDAKVEVLKEELAEKAAQVEMGERELSTEEMEAISQLLSADPVFKEREDLARLKEAISEKIEKAERKEKEEKAPGKAKGEERLTSTPNADDMEKAKAIVTDMETKAAKEAEESTSFSTTSGLGDSKEQSKAEPEDTSHPEEEQEEEETLQNEPEDPVVARLKRRIESMVNKIENQLSDAHIKIGEKLHYLDKDMDGILSREEMAEVMSQVFKNLSFEEALEIADEIDDNKDGVFTVQELIEWIETNKMVKFESEGRDADMDKIMESHSSEKEDVEAKDDEEATKKDAATKQ